MNYLSAIAGSNHLAVALFCVVVFLSELTFYRKEMYYNFSDTERMRDHLLNTRYQLCDREDIDLTYINTAIARVHFTVLAVGGVIMFFQIVLGAMIYLLGSLIGTYLTILKIGEKYKNNPYKPVKK